MGRTIGAKSSRSTSNSSTPVKWKPAHRARQHAERLQHAADVVRQPRRHADQLRPGAEQGTRAVGVERLHVHRPIPTRPHDLRQPLRIVLVGLVHLHLEGGAGMPGVKADNVEPSTSQLVHKPGRHRAGLDANLGVLSRMPLYHTLDLPGVRGALAAPETAPCLVHDADRRQLLRHVQTNKSGHRTASHGANRRATAPGSQHHGRPMSSPRLPDVHTCTTAESVGGHHPSYQRQLSLTV